MSATMTSMVKSSSRTLNGDITTVNDQIADCAGCHQVIRERFMLKAVDQMWHEDCLKCSCCDCRLGEVGSTLFTKANLILCKRDYLRLFGNTGYCSACNKMIPAFEMVMRAKTNVYHLECFACQQCNHRFCVGDKFYLCNDKILCEYDYEERLVFANMSYNYNSIAHIKKQTQNLTSTKQQQMRNIGNSNGPTTSMNTSSSSTMTFSSQNDANLHGPLHPNMKMGAGNHLNSSIVHTSNGITAAGSVVSVTSQSDDTSSGYGSPESPIFDRK